MKHIRLILLFILSFSIACSSDDNVIEGSGDLVTEEQELDQFENVISPSSTDVNVIYGIEQNVTITADDNIINNITTSVNNNALEVNLTPGSYNDITVIANITLPNITSFKTTGDGISTISGFTNLENLTVENTGSGTISLNGAAINFNCINTGSSNIKAFSFIVANCTVNNSGSGDCELFCNTNLSGMNTGSGKVFYKGNATVNITNSGSGNVINSN